jgi:DNA repair protein SbcC/Rad50
LIAAAVALVPPPGQPAQIHEATQRVRELQAEWQQQARTLPLARQVENALWARFKAATDAVFAQREAAFAARDAEVAAELAAREALIARLTTLTGATPAAETQRTLADVDQSWRRAPEIPRAASGPLEARYREARAIVLQGLAESSQRQWWAECDTLAAKLALCDERETADTDADELASRWAAQDALPAMWERALADRWSSPAEPGPLSASAMDELLLQLEAALDLPATPEWQAARRHLKLRALKDALEGRAAPHKGQDRPAQWLAAALRQSGTSTAQRERLRALIDALRRSPAGSLGLAAPHPLPLSAPRA